MAVISFTREENPERRVITWSGASTGDTFTPTSVHTGPFYMASIHVSGTFANGTSVSLQGSNTGANFITLNDVGGTAITMTAEGLVEFSTTSLEIKPVISSGSSDDITVTIVAKG